MQGALRLAMIVVPFAAACSHSQPATTPKNTPPFADKPVSPNLAVSEDLDKQCTLHFSDRVEAPKFDFDRFQLLDADREVLDQIANCLMAGPLKGKRVQLVGRADPRGTEEYNLALGDRRAQTVGDYLTQAGVSEDQLGIVTRGALDATGRDERSWKLDRRVDLRIAKN